MKLLQNRILVKPEEAKEVSKGGIILPDELKEKEYKGTVVATGAGLKDEAMTVKVGDVVKYPKHAGNEVDVDGTPHLIMRETDIYFIV